MKIADEVDEELGVIIQNNIALGFNGLGYPFVLAGRADGGGIYSSGILDVTGCTISNNTVLGGRGGDGDPTDALGNRYPAAPGGSASGGGVYVAGGTATISSSTLTGNTARGGAGGDRGLSVRAGNGGSGFGGAIYASAGDVLLRNVSITANLAQGGLAGIGGGLTTPVPGTGIGGGIYIGTASVGLDLFTKNNLKQNNASTSQNDIAGTYAVLA